MKKKILLLSLTLVLAFSGVLYAAGVKWNGYDTLKLYVSGKEVKATEPPIIVKGKQFIPVSALKKAGISVFGDSKSVKIELPKPRIVYKLTDAQLEELSKSVYKVLGSTDDPNKWKQGSGFIVNDTFITNYHVAGDSATAQVQIDGSWQRTSQYDFADKDVDLMGFKVSGGKSLPTSSELPQVGDPVYDIGFPHGELKISEGAVTSVFEFKGYMQIVHTAFTDNGSSGGILLNGKGEVVGINKSGMSSTSGEPISLAIPVSFILTEQNK